MQNFLITHVLERKGLLEIKFDLSLSCETHKAAEDATELANRMAAELSFIMTSLDLNMDSQNSK